MFESNWSNLRFIAKEELGIENVTVVFLRCYDDWFARRLDLNWCLTKKCLWIKQFALECLDWCWWRLITQEQGLEKKMKYFPWFEKTARFARNPRTQALIFSLSFFLSCSNSFWVIFRMKFWTISMWGRFQKPNFYLPKNPSRHPFIINQRPRLILNN